MANKRDRQAVNKVPNAVADVVPDPSKPDPMVIDAAVMGLRSIRSLTYKVIESWSDKRDYDAEMFINAIGDIAGFHGKQLDVFPRTGLFDDD